MNRVVLPVPVAASQRHSFVRNCYFCKGLHSFVSAASNPAAFTGNKISPGLLEAVNQTCRRNFCRCGAVCPTETEPNALSVLNIFVLQADDSLFIPTAFVQLEYCSHIVHIFSYWSLGCGMGDRTVVVHSRQGQEINPYPTNVENRVSS